MVIIACFALTVMHPGWGFGSVWQEANFSFILRRKGEDDTEAESTINEGSREKVTRNAVREL